jgi:hypothetical protein
MMVNEIKKVYMNKNHLRYFFGIHVKKKNPPKNDYHMNL